MLCFTPLKNLKPRHRRQFRSATGYETLRGKECRSGLKEERKRKQGSHLEKHARKYSRNRKLIDSTMVSGTILGIGDIAVMLHCSEQNKQKSLPLFILEEMAFIMWQALL